MKKKSRKIYPPLKKKGKRKGKNICSSHHKELVVSP